MDKILLILGLGLVITIVATGGFGVVNDLGVKAPSFSFGGSGPLASGSGTSDFYASTDSSDTTVSVPSQKQGRVRIEAVSRGGISEPQNEYILIRNTNSSGNPIAVSLWTVGNSTGNTFQLGFAERIVTQSSLEMIKLRPDEQAYIHTGRSPLGVSFQENTCTGYFNQSHTFNPSLGEFCSRPNTSGLLQFNDACLRFLDKARSCRTLDISGEDSIGIGQSCADYASQHFSYVSCVAQERSKSNFYRPTWHLYLNRPTSIWRSFHDKITLTDEFGQIVDTYEY